MRSRMHEAIAQALAPQGGPGNTLAALDTSDNRLQASLVLPCRNSTVKFACSLQHVISGFGGGPHIAE